MLSFWRGGGSTLPLWRRGRVRRSAGGLLEFRVERHFGKLDLMDFVFVILAIDAVPLTRMGIKRTGWLLSEVFTPFIMLVAASFAVLRQPVCLLLSLYPSLPRFLPWQLSGGGIERFQPAEMGRRMSSGAAGAVRVLDAALSFGQRGIFFLVIGAAAIIVCCLTFLPHAVKKIRRKPGRKTVRRDRQPAAPADQSAFLSDLPERKTEEGGERRE